MTQTVPASWWVPRLPTPVLLVVAGRIVDEATTRDIAWEIEDRLSQSDGCIAWSDVARLPAWQRNLVAPAIERLEAALSAPGGFESLRILADCPSTKAAAAHDGAVPSIAMSDSPDELVSELDAIATARLRGAEMTRGFLAALERRGIHIAVAPPDPDQGDPFAELLPIATGSDQRDRVVRIGLSPFSGLAFWFHRDADHRWRLAAPPREVPGTVASRAGPNNVVVHVTGDDVLLEIEEHTGGGSGFWRQLAILLDMRSGHEVLRVPRRLPIIHEHGWMSTDDELAALYGLDPSAIPRRW